MRSCKQAWIMRVAICLVAACLGCRNGESVNNTGQSSDQPGANRPGQDTQKGGPNRRDPPDANPVPEPLPPPTIPKVELAEKDRAACLVQVGDMMPDAELPDLDGKLQPLAGLRGQKLTVVCFWRSGESLRGELEAVEILGDLGKDFSDPYFQKGVRVIGINEGDQPEVIRKRLADAEVMFPNLLDPDGAFFAQVATEKLPRVYLLDAGGKILWFDLEFSRTTRRNLEQAIRVALGEI